MTAYHKGGADDIKKQRFIFSGLLTIFAIGGFLIVINPFTGEEEPKYKYEQLRVARYLVEHYELANGNAIKTIEFTEAGKSTKTGYWNMSATVNSSYYISISTTDFSAEDIEITDHIAKSKGKELSFRKEASDNSMSEVEVIYYDGEE